VSLSVSIFGLGYVGSVTAACLARQGQHVVGVDSNPQKVAQVTAGQAPVVEPGLQDLIAAACQAHLLDATTDPQEAILTTDVSFISVATPSQRNGKLDLTSIERVCRQIGEVLRLKATFHWIVLRSTILPGTTDTFVTPLLESSSGKRAGRDFGVCFNPEFLREGTAIADFAQPPFTVLGVMDGTDCAPVRQIYAQVPAPLHMTDTRTAEMIKYVCNAFHALKVSFANEVGVLCNELGADARRVTEIFTSDTKLNISPAYLKPGFAFGGSCLPKDLRALTHRARELDVSVPLLSAILQSNHEHIQRAAEDVLQTGKREIGILGLSFKSGTDDLRDSPMVYLVKRLLGEGCRCHIWDQNVRLGQIVGSNREFIQNTIPHIGALLQDDLAEVLRSSEVVLLATKGVDAEEILQRLRKDQILIDVEHLQKAKAAPAVSAPAPEMLEARVLSGQPEVVPSMAVRNSG
jgi:GDP-mannose 6-dehydrogenase